MRVADPPSGAPTAAAVMARASAENFPVASRLLPRRERAHLLAIYGFARLVDELGDAAPGDRLAALDWLSGELDRAFAGEAEHPLMAALAPTLRECSLPREPFERLIEANRMDQRVSRYETWEQLRAYCALSADPVGELVLAVLGAGTPARIALSDAICTGLQLTEHCQDVAEDLGGGARVPAGRGSRALRLRRRAAGRGACGRAAAPRARLRGGARARAVRRRARP